MAKSLINARITEGIGGSHTVVTAVPLDALEAVDSALILTDIQPSNAPINIYTHIAACEHICPFCHYATVRTDIGKEAPHINGYMNALWRELDFWKQKLNSPAVQSIYIGGGTPTALSEERLLSTLSRVQNISSMPVKNICVEASPLTLTDTNGPSKLHGLIDAGVNRISMGLQSFDESILRASRNHGQFEALQAMGILAASGADYNIDLIQDLPGQTEEALLKDIEFIDKFKPPQVTWYICRLHEGSIWHKMSTTGKLEIALSSDESIARRKLIRERMADIGYVASGGGRFTRGTEHDQYKTVRGGADTTMLGIGLSAYSHGWGWFFRNSMPHSKEVNLRKYADLVNSSGHAIQSGYKMQEIDFVAAKTITGVRSIATLPQDFQDSETASYVAHTKSLFNELANQNMMEDCGPNQWRLTEQGRLFEEEICTLFYTSAMRQKLADRASAWWQRDQTSASSGTFDKKLV